MQRSKYASEYHHLYNTPRYKRDRAWFFRQPQNKFCVKCKARGYLVGATTLDHIIPHKGDETLFFDMNNWQGLCQHCHDSAKKMQEIHGYEPGCDAQGNPIDASHPWYRKR